MAAGKFNTTANYDDDIEFIEDSDPVQGDPPGTDPELTPLTGTANKIFQKIIGSLAYLKNAVDNFSIERMTDTVLEGIGRTATQQKQNLELHTVGGPFLTPLSCGDDSIYPDRSACPSDNDTARDIATGNPSTSGGVDECTMHI